MLPPAQTSPLPSCLPPQAPPCFLSVSPHWTPFPVLFSVLFPCTRWQGPPGEGLNLPGARGHFLEPVCPSRTHRLSTPEPVTWGLPAVPRSQLPPPPILQSRSLCTSPLGRPREPPGGLALPVWESVSTLQTPCPIRLLLPLQGRPNVLFCFQPLRPGCGFQQSGWPKAEVSWSSGSNLAPHSPGHWPLLPASNFSSQGGLLRFVTGRRKSEPPPPPAPRSFGAQGAPFLGEPSDTERRTGAPSALSSFEDLTRA